MTNDVALFPDTNALIHYRKIGDIDWRELVDGKGVTLVICPQVVRELDDKKYHNRFADRASRVIREIDRLRSLPSFRPGITLEVPPIAGQGLQHDEEIVAEVVDYLKGRNCEGVVVTNDLGMALRCESAGLRHVAMQPAWSDVVHEERDRTIQQLKKENEKLKSRSPLLELGFATDQACNSTIDIAVDSTFETIDVDEVLRTAEQMVPEVDAAQFAAVGFSFSYGVAGSGKSLEGKELYDDERSRFLTDYRRFLSLENARRSVVARSCSFELMLCNNGGCPASEIEFEIELVGSISVIAKLGAVSKEAKFEDLEVLLQANPFSPPDPPSPVLSAKEAFVGRRYSWQPSTIKSGIDSPASISIEKSTGDQGLFRIVGAIDRLKHHASATLGRFVVGWPSWEGFSKAVLATSMTCSECPDRLKSTLIANVSKLH